MEECAYGRVCVRGPRLHRGLRSRLIRETAVPASQARSARDFVDGRTEAREVTPHQLNVNPKNHLLARTATRATLPRRAHGSHAAHRIAHVPLPRAQVMSDSISGSTRHNGALYGPAITAIAFARCA